MLAEMPQRKKWLLTVLLVIAGMLGVVVWSDSRATAILSKASLDHARLIAGKGASPIVKQFESEDDMVSSSAANTTFCAIGIVLLSFASIVALWSAHRREEKAAPEQPPPTRFARGS